MKKNLSVFFFFISFLVISAFYKPIIAGCNPDPAVKDYSSCPELNPDINLAVRGYVPITGNTGLISFIHAPDPIAMPPQLSTLLERNSQPQITSLYQVYDWNWTSNTKGGLVQKPIDAPNDFATMAGFGTTYGQNVLVPRSGYDIGEGYQTTVLYATQNSITLKYTRQDDVVTGYTIHLENFQVDPQLLALYDKMNLAGRAELPALRAGDIVGQAMGPEILAAIRDSGTFMDPRWQQDWWQTNDPATGQAFILKVLSMIKGNYSSVQLSCNPSNSGDTTSRPIPCDACNQGVPASDCATSFTANDFVTFQKGDGAPQCADGNYYVDKTWTGVVQVDPSKTTIPFVGNKGGESEQKYLADYLEGTSEYYKNYDQDTIDSVSYAGINRKLLPYNYQNTLKGNLIQRAVDGKNNASLSNIVHDYKIKYQSRICWDFPFITDLTLAVLKKIGLPLVSNMSKYTHYCIITNNPANIIKANYAQDLIIAYNLAPFIPFKIDYDRVYWDKEATLTEMANHQPPKSTDPNFEKAWEGWANQDKGEYLSLKEKYGKWYYLWSVVPESSREDTKGMILPKLAVRGKGTEGAAIINTGSEIDKVPHVARLFELSRTLQKTLISFVAPQKLIAEDGTNQDQTGNLSQTETNNNVVLGDSTLLAQASCPQYVQLNIYPIDTQGGGFDYAYEITPTDAGLERYGVDPVFGDMSLCEPRADGSQSMSCLMRNIPLKDGHWYVQSTWGNYTFAPRVNSLAELNNLTFTLGNIPRNDGCPDFVLAKTGGARIPTPTPPICGLPGASAGKCEKPAITDTNPNDTLCCGPINMLLLVQDKVINPQYVSCDKQETVDQYGNIIITEDPECKKEIYVDVSRQFSVSLDQPYLKQAWDALAAPKTGIFNIFRPAKVPQFQPLEAKSSAQIDYKYNSITNAFPDITDLANSVKAKLDKIKADPSSGDMYFPYLGGIQQAKEQTIRSLMPYTPSSQ